MSDFLNYMKAQAEKREAFAELNAAHARFELAQIRDRLAEIRSQHAPLAKLMDAKMSERERLCAAAFYVVVGRLPDTVTAPQDEAHE